MTLMVQAWFPEGTVKAGCRVDALVWFSIRLKTQMLVVPSNCCGEMNHNYRAYEKRQC
jgi:hypothetical protein